MTTIGDHASEMLSALRPDVRENAERADAAVLRPSDQSLVTTSDRLRIALRVALVNDDHACADELAAEIDDAEVVRDVERWGSLPEPTQELLAYCEQVALDPADVGTDEIADLREHFSSAQVVAATQVAAYASFRSRLLSGLRLVAGCGDGPAAEAGVVIEAGCSADGGDLSTPEEAFPQLKWASRIEGSSGDDQFASTLRHDPAALAAQTALREAIMAGRGSLDRADRELAALATSLVNGCEYCCGVHGRRQVELSGDRLTAVVLAEAGPAAIADPQLRAVVDAAGKLARTPAALAEPDVRRLHQAGLDADDVHDLVAVASMFAWDNRLIMALGNAVRPS
ncbi:peroxidase-related enzyme [Saccharopolyspora griseoalba]|uniref:Peroxidase-related enzyme n=1 Tax=Saccharopolyspora griseoalba TaxID=1431848 RepID=A0ABW2LFN9_9PSEU